MEPEKKLEASLLDMYAVMPSTGSYPFTMMVLTGAESAVVSVPPANSSASLVVLKRTDFNESDLIDYVVHTKEYADIPLSHQEDFLDIFRRKSRDANQMTAWCERITGMGIGIISQLAVTSGIWLKPVDTDLAVLDNHFQFNSKNLQAYQVFNIIPLDSDDPVQAGNNH